MALLKPGMTADAEITLEMSKDVVLVPLWAVRKDSDTGKRYITVRDAEPTDNGLAENPTKEVEVKLGLRDGSMGEVISGATEGQVVFEPVVN
jgi:multidrug efflux pump subunit AcrA (membrane-fusion protein)